MDMLIGYESALKYWRTVGLNLIPDQQKLRPLELF